MAPDDPLHPRPSDADRAAAGGVGSSGSGTGDALRRLEERLDRASEAAERLILEAAESAAAAGSARAPKPPPAGWRAPEDSGRSGHGGDLELLVQVVQSLRELIPPDLQRRLAEALRELLLAVRALIDWYLERAERHRAAPAEVEDIPIL
jgi:hypothetical protein